jgi:lycopene cyclase domain-containing protein
VTHLTYTQLAVLGVVTVVVIDMFVLRTRLLRRRAFWVAYAIVVFFQLVTNGVLTGFSIVRYAGDEIIGSERVVFVGDGRLVFAPVEDLMFGFALVVLSLALWVWWGRRGVQYRPVSGPPRWVDPVRPSPDE